MQKMNVFGAAYWLREVDSGVIANFQTVFNLLTAVALIPFTNQLVKLSIAVVKDEPEQEVRHPELHTLVENLYISPAVAVFEATKAVAHMGEIALENFKRASAVLQKYDPVAVAEINADEECLDQFSDAADRFMIGLSKVIETEADDRQLDLLMQTVPSFERVGDYATNFVELAQRMEAEGASFSEGAKKELEIICGAVNEILTITVEAVSDDDNEKAKTIEPLEETVDDMVMILRDRHTKRLKSGACSISSGLVFMETLTYLERAADHCSSIAVMMLARNNEAILQNHYDYLKEIHSGNDAQYRAERDRRRGQYITPLNNVQ
jgi:phosphate:Na+ symporter